MPNFSNRASRLVTQSGSATARAELAVSATDRWSVPMLQAAPAYGSDPREAQFGPSTVAQRLRWLLFGPPDIIEGINSTSRVPLDIKGRVKWFFFGPGARDDTFSTADKRRYQAETEAAKREGQPGQRGPGLYGSPTNPFGFVDQSLALDGMAVIWVDGFDKKTQDYGGPLVNMLKQTDFEPYVYVRHLSAVFDKVWPASYRANTDLGYNPYTGMGLASAGWHVMPADTTPPNVTDGQGIQARAPWTRVTLRVPRYSTMPAIVEPIDSPTP